MFKLIFLPVNLSLIYTKYCYKDYLISLKKKNSYSIIFTYFISYNKKNIKDIRANYFKKQKDIGVQHKNICHS